jgi:hypothetical protein
MRKIHIRCLMHCVDKISFLGFEKITGLAVLNVYHGKRCPHLDCPGI